MTRLDDGCRGAGPMFKPKRLAPIVKALEGTGHAGNEIPREYAEASLKALREGAKENEGSATNVRVVVDATSSEAGGLNLHYVVVDREGTLCAMSVYGLEDGAVTNLRVLSNTTDDKRFGKCLMRKFEEVTFPRGLNAEVELHLDHHCSVSLVL